MIRRDTSWAGLRLLLAAALLAASSSGCASRLFQRAGRSDWPAPASSDGRAGKAAGARDDRRVASADAQDDVGGARARAEQNPAEPYWPYREAQLEFAARHAGQAETALRAALARDSVYAPALTLLSRLLYEQGRHAEAIRLLAPVRDARVSLEPADRSAVLAGLALNEAALGHDVEARALFGGLAPRDRARTAGVAAYLAVRGASADSARTLAEAAVQAAPGSAANHNNLGIALLRLADPDGAAREFERAIELDGSLPGPWYNLAILDRWYRLDRDAAAKRFGHYWSRSHADPDSLYAELGRGSPTPVAEEGPNR